MGKSSELGKSLRGVKYTRNGHLVNKRAVSKKRHYVYVASAVSSGDNLNPKCTEIDESPSIAQSRRDDARSPEKVKTEAAPSPIDVHRKYFVGVIRGKCFLITG